MVVFQSKADRDSGWHSENFTHPNTLAKIIFKLESWSEQLCINLMAMLMTCG